MSGCWRGSQRGRGGTGDPGETRRGPGGLGRGGVRGGSQSWGGSRGPGGPRGAAGFLVSARGARAGLRGHRLVPEGTGGGSHKEPGWWGGPSRLCPPQPHQPTPPPPPNPPAELGRGLDRLGQTLRNQLPPLGPESWGGWTPPGTPPGPRPPDEADVVVVGGGVVGWSVAYWLKALENQRHGMKVLVVERDPTVRHPPPGVGCGLGDSPPAKSHLFIWGGGREVSFPVFPSLHGAVGGGDPAAVFPPGEYPHVPLLRQLPP